MTEQPYSSHIAVKLNTTVPESGELKLTLPFVAGQQVEVLVVAEGAPFVGATEAALPAAEAVPVNSVTDPVAVVAGDNEAVDPRRVSEVLRELSDELISRYETLFRVERKAEEPKAEEPKATDE